VTPSSTVPDRRPRRASTPPVWAGCDLEAWGRLLARHRFAVHRSRWRRAALVTAAAAGQSLLRLADAIALRHRVARAAVTHPPVFVLGHWRSGTTLLHELLARDPRHAAPTAYECFNPHHFTLTRRWLPRLLGGFSVGRPMDAVPAGWDRPQEDEFALALVGVRSPYERIAFPNLPADPDGLDPDALPPRERRAWERALSRLVQALTLAHDGRRLILKSPPHTGRVPALLRLFPDARFVRVVRDPFAVYPSTLHLWRVLFTAHGLQPPAWERLPEYVLDTFARLDAAFEAARPIVPPGRVHELRYEDLVRDPLGELAAAYARLDLGPLDPVGAAAYLATARGHEPAAHLLTADERRAVAARWGAFARRHGYDTG
jgi:hypothetical protein